MAATDTNAYSNYDIDRRYDDPSNYGKYESHDGDGRYPPDWEARREAVMERQNYWCGRCGRYAGDVSSFHVHHLQFLSEGGSNALENLVALCQDCHALMHPDNDEMQGDWQSAPMFPDADADPRAAVIREPTTAGEFHDVGQHLAALETIARPPTVNDEAYSSACYALSTDDTRRAVESFEETVDDYGLAIPDGRRGIHLRVLDPDGDFATGVEAAVEIGNQTITKTVDGRGHVTFHVPDSCDEVSVWIGGGDYQSEELTCSFETPDHVRASELVVLSHERDERKSAGTDRSGGATADSPEVSTTEAVVGWALVGLAGYGGWEYMGLQGAFGAAFGMLLLVGAVWADLEDR